MHPISRSAIAAALLALSSPSLGQEPVIKTEQVDAVPDEQIVARLAETVAALEAEGFSGFAAVARGGKPIALAEAGAADAATGRAYDLDTQFDIGSVVKPLTGLAAAQLIAAGKLDPQATLADFFDDVPEDKAGITVHQMLTHTAGLEPAHGFDLRPLSREGMLAAAFGQTLIAPPGERYSYSNTGFSLVAAIIEVITGEPYEDYMVDKVLRPLGLNSTGYRSVYDPSRAAASQEYGVVSRATWGDLDPVSWALIGNGGMVSSATDLLRLGQVIAADGLPREVAETWLTPRVDEGGGTSYGYGIGFQQIPGLGPISWHNGGSPGFQTEWWTLRDSGLTILIHRNGGPLSLSQALGPVLTAATGVEMAFADGGSDVDMIEGTDLPDSPAGELAGAFLEAIRADEDAWRDFVTSRMSAALLDQFPIEDHMRQYPMLHGDIGQRRITGHGVKDGELHLRMEIDDAPPLFLVLFHAEQDGQVKLRGIGIN